jgi:hypothetical protein
MSPSPSVAPGPVADPTWITPSLIMSGFSFLVSILALAGTFGLFWFLNLRRGRLLCPPPHSFAARFLVSELLITLPLVLHNDGARIRVLRDLRLTLEKTPEQAAAEREALEAAFEDSKNLLREGTTLQIEPDMPRTTMSWRARRDQLQPRSDTDRTMPAVFAVNPRSADTYFIEFGGRSPQQLRRGPHRATVEAKLSGEHGWWELLVFDLHTEKVDRPQYITYSNDPEWEA